MNIKILFSIALAGILLSSPVSAQVVGSPAVFEYQVGPENILQIDVYYGNGEKISQKVRVSARGTIIYPLVGEVLVANMTISQIQERLSSLLEKDYLVNPQVNVFIEEYSTVSIMGEVKRPGIYQIKGRLTVVELISMAEGFTKIAAPNKVKVIRKNLDGTKGEFFVKVYDIMNKDGAGDDSFELKAGDVVMVRESVF